MTRPESKVQFDRADHLCQQGQYAKAMDLLVDLNIAFPSEEEILFRMAVCQLRMRNVDQAGVLCDRLVQEFSSQRARELQAQMSTSRTKESTRRPRQPRSPAPNKQGPGCLNAVIGIILPPLALSAILCPGVAMFSEFKNPVLSPSALWGEGSGLPFNSVRLVVLRSAYLLILMWACWTAFIHCIFVGQTSMAHFGKWRAGSRTGAFDTGRLLSLLKGLRDVVVTLLLPAFAVFVLGFPSPQSLDRILYGLTRIRGIQIPAWLVCVFLVSVIFTLRIIWMVARVWLGAAAYRVRFGRLLRQRQGQVARFGEAQGMKYTDRVAEFYPLEWVTTGTGKPSPRHRSDWLTIVRKGTGHAVYDVWKGIQGYACNILTSRCKDYAVHLFDYHYAEDGFVCGQGRSWAFIVERGQSDCTIAALELPRALPPLSIYPEAIWDKIGMSCGGIDIDMESMEVSKAYRIWSKERRFAYAVFNAPMMELLSAHPSVAIRIAGNVLSLRFPKLVPVEKLPECLGLLDKAYRLIPAFVFEKSNAAAKPGKTAIPATGCAES